MVLLLRKLYLYFIKDPERSIIFRGGGGGEVSNFFPGGGGPNANFYRNTYACLLFSGVVSGPHIFSGSTHGQCHHNTTIFSTVWPLTIIVRP